MKNIFKKTVTMVLALSMLTGAAACDTGETPPPDDGSNPPANQQTPQYALDATSVELTEGETKKIEITATPAQESISATFESSATDIATVAADGTVTAVKAGTATITVKVGDETLTCTVTVKAAPVTYEYALNVNTMNLMKGDTRKLTVIATPDKENITAVWASEDDDVATVEQDGTVTAVGAGSTKINAVVDGKTVSCTVTVANYTYSINKTTQNLLEGETFQLIVTADPEKTLTPSFESSATDVATVAQDGTVTAVGGGTATVTVTVDGETFTCTVNVTEYAYNLNYTEYSLQEGNSVQLSVTVSPDKQFTPSYRSGNTSVATVSDTGLVTAVKEGTASIIVSVNGKDVATCNVTVTAIPYEYVLSTNTASLKLGGTVTLDVTATPSKDAIQKVYKSNDESVATVTQEGLITAVGVGETTIEVTADGSKPMTCTVTVTSDVSATASLKDIAGATVLLSAPDSSVQTLYWEHYQSGVTESKKGATDLIETDVLAQTPGSFGDYKGAINWIDGTATEVWAGNTNGVHSAAGQSATIEIAVKVTTAVKQIRVYTGAWNAENVTSLWWNGYQIAQAEAFTAGGDSLAREVTFAVDVKEATTVTVKVAATPAADTNGNASIIGIAVLGGATTASTALSLTKTELQGRTSSQINLTESGAKDWFYLNYDHVSDSKKNGTGAIKTDSLYVKDQGAFWDYKADFKWTDGTRWETSPLDNGESDVNGTNNGYCGTYVKITVAVDAATSNVKLYVGGWQSTYFITALDSNGNIVFNEKMADGESGVTHAYEANFSIAATKADEITFIISKSGAGNCSLAAVAVS